MPIRALPRPRAAAARALRPALVAGALVGLVAGCAADGNSSASSDRSTARATVTATVTASASAAGARTETPTSTPTTTPTKTPGAAATASTSAAVPRSPGPLLGAAELPGFDDAYRWRPGTTTPREPRTSFGTCQRFGLLAIGAERVVVRRYRPPAGSPADRAGELVATFPDPQTARRAYAVLTAWHKRCGDRLSRYRHHQVGQLREVAVGAGTASWYQLTYGPVPGRPHTQLLDAQGTALVGPRIAMLTLVRATREGARPSGPEPMPVAVGRAAQKLG